MSQFDTQITVSTVHPVSLNAGFIQPLSSQEQSMISGGEIRTCENGLKPFMGDMSTCPENKKKAETSSSSAAPFGRVINNVIF